MDKPLSTPAPSSDITPDDQLIARFLAETRHEVAPASDDLVQGIMERLPQPAHSAVRKTTPASQLWQARLWTLCCTAVFVVLFFVLGGPQTVEQQLVSLVATPPKPSELLSLYLCVATATALVGADLMRRERLL